MDPHLGAYTFRRPYTPTTLGLVESPVAHRDFPYLIARTMAIEDILSTMLAIRVVEVCASLLPSFLPFHPLLEKRRRHCCSTSYSRGHVRHFRNSY